MTRRVPAILLPLCLLLGTVPAAVSGQACVGVLTPEDGVSLSVGSEFDHGLSLLGGRLDANTGSRFSLGIGFYSGQSGQPTGTSHAFRTSGLLEVETGDLGICPLVALVSSSGELPGGPEVEEQSRSHVGLEVGVGVGRTLLERGPATLSWHVVPHLLLDRTELDAATPSGSSGEEGRFVDVTAALGARMGVGLALGLLQATGEVGVRTGGQRGVVTGLSVGVRF